MADRSRPATRPVPSDATRGGAPNRTRLPAWLANLLLVLLAAALWPGSALLENLLDPYVLQILILVGINVILATSLNLINGITGQFSLGHAGFMGVGAYTAGILLRYYQPAHAAPLAYVGCLALGGLMAGLSGLLIGVPTLRLRGDYLAIATLGFGEILRTVVINTEQIGPMKVGGNSGLHGIPSLNNFFWTYAGVLACVVTVWRLVHSAKGRAFLAVREDETAAAAMGVDTTFYKVAAFVVGALFAGIAGGLLATTNGDIDPDRYRFTASIEIVVMVVLGGSGSISGVILAAVVLTILPEGLRYVKEWTGEDLRLVIYSLLLIGMMLLRPEGILGNREIWWTRRRAYRTVSGA